MGGHAKRHWGNIKDRDTDNLERMKNAEREMTDAEWERWHIAMEEESIKDANS